MPSVLECVPNFSEGRDHQLINKIADRIQSVEGVSLLDIDPGASANRTVITFVGDPEAVVEAAFLGIKEASQLIDMGQHQGEHPRMGATDVCPLIPISGISMEEAVALAHQLAKRVGEELGIPVYLYENAATQTQRQNLATIRSGEYEGFKSKILSPEWKPDYGPQQFNAHAGQTVIGARDFLIAYNVNLNSRSVAKAKAVAGDVRESGRAKIVDGKKVRDTRGEIVREAGKCKAVKAIGWYMEQYGVAQVSTNLTDINQTPVHIAFEAIRNSARARGMRVTGSELVGMIPKRCLLEAGQYYLDLQGIGGELAEEELIYIAIKSLGLDDLGPFDPQKKVIEYRMAQAVAV
ncbi:MAG: glutamate formimidoyltransferase [Bacteroidota bacterium]